MKPGSQAGTDLFHGMGHTSQRSRWWVERNYRTKFIRLPLPDGHTNVRLRLRELRW